MRTVTLSFFGDTDWGDLLTAHNGSTISYDAIGNPLSDANRSFTWEHGRQMATQTRGDTTWTYTYDANGMRTSRSNGTKTYEYVYSGDKLVQMTVTDISANTERLIEFSYDAVGQPLTMTLDGTVYYYLLNIQGDVMGLVDGSGNLLVSYLYEAYGECFYITDTSDMVNTLIGANPLLYRSYLIDTGTGLYYLQSRYYDPQLGRFINADGLTSTGQGLLGNNMFTYCLNNPVNKKDGLGALSVEATPNGEMITIQLKDKKKWGPIEIVIVIEGDFNAIGELEIPLGDYEIIIGPSEVTVVTPKGRSVSAEYDGDWVPSLSLERKLVDFSDKSNSFVGISTDGIGLGVTFEQEEGAYSIAVYVNPLAWLAQASTGGGGSSGSGGAVYYSGGGGGGVSFYMTLRNPTMQLM